MAGKSVPVSPLAPKKVPKMPAIEGVAFATAEAGIRYKGRTDVLLARFSKGTAMAGVFTRSKCPSAPVDWCRSILPGGRAAGLVVNSGNANAFTGLKGREAVALTAKIAAKALGCKPEDVALASTGVIGEPLDATKFEGVLADCATRVNPTAFMDAARAIMTTDTFPKVATRKAKIDGIPVTLSGIAKGAGMIAPDMATMLSFVFTDATIAPSALQALLSKGVKDSFNAVTVDSDTSTSDTLLLFATGAAAARGQMEVPDAKDRRLVGFKRALNALLLDLAVQVARDGEGARKLISIAVEGATSARSAKKIALSIANSPLVKTAVAGEDANWGRIVMAVGKAGEPADRDRISIRFGDIRVAHEGARDPSYSEAATTEYMKRDVIDITVSLGIGRGKSRVYTCDLTKAYVEINGDYRS
ncbi:MAG: bifunctional glutamate N-acetyltransferase/amino-acid acetyltransferase ArgJ [Rhizobiales bacterium]|nr:bifunctional glutamate N-acetyltransferase/amino-acid acetyltransferase ArgJ [Hyphomicrobiales bacterium]